MKDTIWEKSYGPRIRMTETNTMPDMFNGEPVYSNEIVCGVGLMYFYKKKDGSIGQLQTKQYRKKVPLIIRWLFHFRIFLLKKLHIIT